MIIFRLFILMHPFPKGTNSAFGGNVLRYWAKKSLPQARFSYLDFESKDGGFRNTIVSKRVMPVSKGGSAPSSWHLLPFHRFGFGPR